MRVVVVKVRDFRLTEEQMSNVALEWEGYPLQQMGGVDDLHFEFAVDTHAIHFVKSLQPFKI